MDIQTSSVKSAEARKNILSFIILTWNSKCYIKRCIDSILNTVDKDIYPFEIIVVDNGSQDGTTEVLQEITKQNASIIKPIMLSTNTGTTYSRNLALIRAQGEYICILDSDVEVFFGTIKHLVDNLQSDPSIGLIAPRLIYRDGRFQKSTDRFPTIQSKLFRIMFLKLQERTEHARGEKGGLREVEYAISAFWILRRSLLERVGLLDENIFYAPEDVDYCLRIWKSGMRVLYDPSICAIHDAQEISRKMRINHATIAHIRGLAYYFKKHNYYFKKPLLRLVAEEHPRLPVN